MMFRALIASTVVLAAAGSVTVSGAHAQTQILVPQDKPTIQSAIQASSNGDVVVVSAGTYRENINFEGKAITVESASGPKSTFIDGGALDTVVRFTSGETRAAVLKGFTIQHGYAATNGYDGGGIYIAGSSPTIENNNISYNVAGSSGAGIAVSGGSPLIRGNFISYNGQIQGYSGGVGGGAISLMNASGALIAHNVMANNSWYSASGGALSLFAAGTPTIIDNKIRDNGAYDEGGGLSVVNDSDATIVQNLFVNNSVSGPHGNAWSILVPSGSAGPLLVNNTVVSNAGHGTALYFSGFDQNMGVWNTIVLAHSGENGVYCDPAYQSLPPNLQHNNIYTMGGTAYGGSCAGDIANYGNISAAPRLGTGYVLQAGSPSINAGLNTAPYLPAKDLAGNPRIVGGVVDQGAYEYQG